jgi:hypothetical protein
LTPQRFDRWWAHFSARFGNEDSYAVARRLRRKIRRVKVDARPDFLRRLFGVLLRQERSYGVALFLLDAISDPVYLRELAELMRPLPALQSEDEESHLSDLVRILAAVNDPEFLPVVEEYLLDRPIGPHWPSVPWALWPAERDLFSRAWCRFLSRLSHEERPNTLIVKTFLSEPDAICAVRDRLRHESPDRWEELREALLRHAGDAGWMSAGQREALEQAIA